MVDTEMVTTIRPSKPCGSGKAARARTPPPPTGGPITWLRTALVCLALPVVACTSSRASLDSSAITPEALLAGTALGLPGGSAETLAEDQVLALSPEMREFLDKHVDRRGSEKFKLHELASVGCGTISQR